jgi:hypothetical protein
LINLANIKVYFYSKFINAYGAALIAGACTNRRAVFFAAARLAAGEIDAVQQQAIVLQHERHQKICNAETTT